jgi:hypothetical protein
MSPDECGGSQSQQLTSDSKMFSQSSAVSQYTSPDKFLNSAVVLPLDKIIQLRDVSFHVHFR